MLNKRNLPIVLLVSALGIAIALKTFAFAGEPPTKYERILKNVSELLQEIHSLLRPNGILFVDVPDAEGGGPGPDRIHIAHVYHYSTHSLGNLLAKSGFEVVCMEKGREQDAWTFHVVAKKAANVEPQDS